MRRLLHSFYRRLETIAHPLRYLFVEITQRCNLACRHCGSDCGRDAHLAELTTDQWLSFFAYLGARGLNQKTVLVLTGGEPLCHPELDRLLGGLLDARLSFGMVTNGVGLTGERAERLLRAGLSSLTVSLDGLERSHDWLRGRTGAFARATRGITIMAAARLPYLDVVTCVHPGNLVELPALGRLLADLGVSRWRLFSIFGKGRAREHPELLLSPGDFRALLAFVARCRKERSYPLEVNLSCEGYLPGPLDSAVRDEPYFCRAGISIGSVLCDGAISACPNLSRRFVQGHLLEDDFLEVWERRFAPFRDRRWMRTGPCAGCAQFGKCQGNSLHLWDEDATSPSICTLAMVTEVAISSAEIDIIENPC